jgi:hypothetical protein
MASPVGGYFSGRHKFDSVPPSSRIAAYGMDLWKYEDVEEALGREEAAGRDPPPKFASTQESELERGCVRCVGASCFVVFAFLTFTWIIHSIPLSWVSEAPAFARSLLWLSVAHNTPEWAEHYGALPPPPPQFLDGQGNRL